MKPVCKPALLPTPGWINDTNISSAYPPKSQNVFEVSLSDRVSKGDGSIFLILLILDGLSFSSAPLWVVLQTRLICEANDHNLSRRNTAPSKPLGNW